MEDDKAVEMLRAIQGDYHPFRHGPRLLQLRKVLETHPNARLVKCRDENTGQRFGRARCRTGQAVKIGSTSWSPTYRGKPYQLWAVWED